MSFILIQPYNTGAKDWKYNNKFVDDNDGYRHSKWLNMMEKRLILAKNLLSQKGFIILAIDHYELFNLGLLCDGIFGEENRCGIVTIVHKPEGRNQEKFLELVMNMLYFIQIIKLILIFKKLL